MTDTDKYIKLLGTIILTFVGFIIALALVILGLRYIFGLLDFMPWFSVMFTLIIICVPALLFITVYLIYVRHTKPHPSKAAKIFSYIIFSIALAAWLYFWVLDFIIFFKHHYNNIEAYHCYNLAFLAANVFFIFLVGIVQALSTNKEIGWMEKNKQREDTLDSDH
jgi:chromate transport protein ChrA